MSNWTHVAAIFRVDHFGFPHEEPLDFDKIFGKECLYHSSQDLWDEAEKHPEEFLPMGSEGSLHKSVWENPDHGCIAAYTVSVFGDLRDHDSLDDIIEWFNKTCEKLWIRQAVVTVDNEWYGSRTLNYKEDS